MWRYAIGRGDDDPARAEFVSEAQARLRAEATAERRRQAARRGREAFLERLRAEGRDVGQYFAQLARKSNAVRRARRNIAPARSKPRPQSGAQTSDNLPRRTCRARMSHTGDRPISADLRRPPNPIPV